MRIFFLFFLPTYLFGQCLSIQSPIVYSKSPHDNPTIFLAGSAYFPWRDELKKALKSEAIILFDPINDALHFENQAKRIDWEHLHIDQADLLVVWLPKGDMKNVRSQSMTSLFELGRFIQSKKPVVIGIDPQYILREELILQLKNLRPELNICDSLEELQKQIMKKTDVYRTEKDSNLQPPGPKPGALSN